MDREGWFFFSSGSGKSKSGSWMDGHCWSTAAATVAANIRCVSNELCHALFYQFYHHPCPLLLSLPQWNPRAYSGALIKMRPSTIFELCCAMWHGVCSAIWFNCSRAEQRRQRQWLTYAPQCPTILPPHRPPSYRSLPSTPLFRSQFPYPILYPNVFLMRI